MSTKWSAETLGKTGKPDFASLLKDEYKIMLLRGKNIFGDFVYCYLKISMADIPKLEAAIKGDQGFNLHDFGTVLAAGKGEPTAEVIAEIDAAYPTIEGGGSADSSGGGIQQAEQKPLEKKNWDEY